MLLAVKREIQKYQRYILMRTSLTFSNDTIMMCEYWRIVIVSTCS